MCGGMMAPPLGLIIVLLPIIIPAAVVGGTISVVGFVGKETVEGTVKATKYLHKANVAAHETVLQKIGGENLAKTYSNWVKNFWSNIVHNRHSQNIKGFKDS